MNRYIYLLIISAAGIIFNIQEVTARTLKILIYVNYFPSPSETFVLNQIIGLVKQGHDVTILAAQAKTALPQAMQKTLAKILIRYNLKNKIFRCVLPANKRNFDILLCQFGTLAPSLLHLKQQLRLRGKLVTFFRGNDISEQLQQNKHLYNKLFNIGDFFIPVCQVFKDKLIHLGCDPTKIQVIHSGINCAQLPFAPKTLECDQPVKIITVSRLVEKKGIEYGIHAIHNLLQKQIDLEYTVIGDGPLRQKLQKLINSLGIEKRVKLLGWHSHEEVIQLLLRSHIFVLPSLTAHSGDAEGIPNALKEAMALGLPVISTYHSGIPELIQDGINGFLVPERDSIALEQKILYLLENRQLWHQLNHNARLFVEQKFDIYKTNEQLHKLLTTLARTKRTTQQEHKTHARAL